MDQALRQELEGLAPYAELEPRCMRGRWSLRSGCPEGGWREVVLDYGSGMGDWCVQRAQREPQALFVGLEKEGFCVAKAAAKAREAQVPNAVFCLVDEDLPLQDVFAPGELSLVRLNFPTPHPRARDAHRRMVHAEMLETYRLLLASGGRLQLKTDSKPLFDWTMTQLHLCGWQVAWSSGDAREALPDDPVTGYEHRLVEEGARIYALEARPGGKPASLEQTAPQSLYDYLPDELESLDYVPVDMRRSVDAVIEARRRVEELREQIARKKAGE